MESTQSNATIGRSLLIYMTAMVLLITFVPFRFHAPAGIAFGWSFGPAQFIQNIMLFFPIGFLFRHSGKERSRFYWKAICFGVGLSLFIEILQAFIVGRYTSGVDVIANGAGAFFGAWFFDYASAKIRDQIAFKVSSLRIPLVNLVLLLTPLLWLTCISAGKEPVRLYLLLPLGTFGSGLLSSVYVNRLALTGVPPSRFAVTAGVWLVLSTLPAMIPYPKDILIIWITLIVIIFVQALFQKPVSSENRRFEMSTLKKLIPVYGCYLLILVLLPSVMEAGKFAHRFELTATIRVVEFIAAFTVLGFMTAEMRGRKDESVGISLIMAYCFSMGLIVLKGLLQGADAVTLQNIVFSLAFIGASLYGCMIYRFQLSAFKRVK